MSPIRERLTRSTGVGDAPVDCYSLDVSDAPMNKRRGASPRSRAGGCTQHLPSRPARGGRSLSTLSYRNKKVGRAIASECWEHRQRCPGQPGVRHDHALPTPVGYGPTVRLALKTAAPLQPCPSVEHRSRKGKVGRDFVSRSNPSSTSRETGPVAARENGSGLLYSLAIGTRPFSKEPNRHLATPESGPGGRVRIAHFSPFWEVSCSLDDPGRRVAGRKDMSTTGPRPSSPRHGLRSEDPPNGFP